MRRLWIMCSNLSKTGDKNDEKKMKLIAKIITVIVLGTLLLNSGCSDEGIKLPILDEDRCVGCGECVPSCPYDAIALIDGKPVIDPAKCIGCGICVDACIYGALYLP